MGVRCAIRTKVTLPDKRFCVAITGSVHELGRWDRLRPVLGIYQGNGVWQVRVKLPTDVDIEYKWILYEQRGCRIVDYEPGENRRLRVVDVPLMVDDYLNGVQEIRVMENDEMTDLHHCSAMATAQFGKGTNKWMADFTGQVAAEICVSEMQDKDNGRGTQDIPSTENGAGRGINEGAIEPVNPEVPERDTRRGSAEIPNLGHGGGQSAATSTDPVNAAISEVPAKDTRLRASESPERSKEPANTKIPGVSIRDKRRRASEIPNLEHGRDQRENKGCTDLVNANISYVPVRDTGRRASAIPNLGNGGGRNKNDENTDPVHAPSSTVPERDTRRKASEIPNPEQRGGQRRRRSEYTDPVNDISSGIQESENGYRSRRKSNLERQKAQSDSNEFTRPPSEIIAENTANLAAHGTDLDQKRRQFDRNEDAKPSGFSKTAGSGNSTKNETELDPDSERTTDEMEDVFERSMRVEDLKVEVLSSKQSLQRLLGRVRDVNPIVKLFTSDVFKRNMRNMLKIGGTTAVAFIAVILYRVYSEDDVIDPDMFL